MSESSSRPTLSAHEIMRFSIEHKRMRVRHVGLHYDRVFVSLRDDTRQRNLWELVQLPGSARLTRFPKLYPVGFDGPFGGRFEGSITQDHFMRVMGSHRPAIVAKIQDLVGWLTEQRASAYGLDDAAVDDRLQEIQQVASRLFPADFPR